MHFPGSGLGTISGTAHHICTLLHSCVYSAWQAGNSGQRTGPPGFPIRPLSVRPSDSKDAVRVPVYPPPIKRNGKGQPMAVPFLFSFYSFHGLFSFGSVGSQMRSAGLSPLIFSRTGLPNGPWVC